MSFASDNQHKLVLWDGSKLYLKEEGKVRTLGGIATRKGRLTRVQKLKAVQHTNRWIEI